MAVGLAGAAARPLPLDRERAGRRPADPALRQRPHLRHALRARPRLPRRRRPRSLSVRRRVRAAPVRLAAAGRRVLELPRGRGRVRRRRDLDAAMLPQTRRDRDRRRLRGRRARPSSCSATTSPPTASARCRRPSASDALRLCRYNQPDLLLLDLALPDASGLDVLREIREADGVDSRFDPRLPVIVLTGRGADADRVRGLECGADDYVVKPFHYPRAAGADRRRPAAAAPATATARAGSATSSIDPARRKAWVGDREVTLSNKEFSLLRVLAADPTRVFTKDELLRRGLGLPHPGADPDARLARQPAAAQARPRARPLRRQLLGRRLQAGRRVTAWRTPPAGRWPPRWRRPGVRRLRAGGGAARSTRRCTSCAGRCRRLPSRLGPGAGGDRRIESSMRAGAAALDRLDRGDQRRAGSGPRRAARCAAAAAGCGRALAGAGGARRRLAGAALAGGRARSSTAIAPASRRRSTT